MAKVRKTLTQSLAGLSRTVRPKALASKEPPSLEQRHIGTLRRELSAERGRPRRAEGAADAWQDDSRVLPDNAPMPALIRDARGRHVNGNSPWAARFRRPLEDLV